MSDGLICGMCRGEKVIRTSVSNYTKVDICPLCLQVLGRLNTWANRYKIVLADWAEIRVRSRSVPDVPRGIVPGMDIGSLLLCSSGERSKFL